MDFARTGGEDIVNAGLKDDTLAEQYLAWAAADATEDNWSSRVLFHCGRWNFWAERLPEPQRTTALEQMKTAYAKYLNT